MPTTSYWHRDNREHEVIVIGAGIAGLSASRELQRRGINHVVLERGVIGCGASTRNAGYLMRGAADNYAAACREFGRDTAKALWRWSENNLQALREAGIESLRSYQARPSCLLAVDDGEARELEESRTLLQEDGFEVGWHTEGADAAWTSGMARVGLVNPNDAVCNPAELIRWIAGPVFEHVRQGVEVESVDLKSSKVSIQTNAGEYRCERLLVCTNAFTESLLPEFRDRITPRRGQMLALDAPEVSLDCAYYINHGHEYIREAGDGVIALGGCRGLFADQEVGEDDTTTDNVQGALEDFAERLLGRRYPVLCRWAGTMGFSPTALPMICRIPSLEGHAWFCGGFTGHGMSLAHTTATAAVAQMLDESSCLFSRVS